MGKTYFLRELADLAMADPRWTVTVSRADEIEFSEPFSFIERLVASSGMHDWFFVPDEQTDPIRLARECVQRLAPDADAPHRLVVIDDAQWIDAESHRVLRYLIPRLARRRVLLAFGARSPHARGSFGKFLHHLVSESTLDVLHTIEPLTADEITALVLERHSAGIPTQTAERILEVTGGSFLGVDSVLSALTEHEIAQLHLAWDTPIRADTTHDALLHHYLQLDPPAQRACELVCLAGQEFSVTPLGAAARALGEPVDVEAAIASDVLTKSRYSSMIMPRHALLAEAVAESMSPDRAQATYRALAATTKGHRSLQYTLRGADAWTEELSARVHAFVADATAKRNFENANGVLRGALAVATEPGDRLELLESLALVNLQANTSYLLVDLLDEFEQLSTGSALHEFICVVLSAHRVGEAYPMERAMQLLMTPMQTPEDRTIVAFLAFMAVLLTMRSSEQQRLPMLIAHARMLTEQAPGDPAELTDQRLAWMVSRESRVLVLDSYLMVNQQMRLDMDAVRESLPGLVQRIDALPDDALKIDALVAVAGAKLAIGEADEARALAQRGVDLLPHVGEPWAASTARVILADCLVMQGEFAAAVDLIERTEAVAYSSLDVEARSSWAALRVIIAAITGKDDDTGRAAQARRQRLTSWEGYAPDLTVLAECELARVHGDPHAVLAASSGEWVDRVVNTRHGFLTFRVHALIDTGQLDAAAELIDQLAAWRGTRWQEYWGSLNWLRARLAQARHDSQTALWHYEAAIESQPSFPVPLALTYADYGSLLRQVGRDDEASQAMRSAERILERIGADGYLPRVRAALDVVPGALHPDGRDALLDALTDRERQVAEHLAKGRSNNQIAESLVVSVTTVRSHVSNVLRKLRLSSRGEVAKLMLDEKPTGG